MSKKNREFSRNIQQEQEEFDRRAKQVPTKKNSRKPGSSSEQEKSGLNKEQYNTGLKEKCNRNQRKDISTERQQQPKKTSFHRTSSVYHEPAQAKMAGKKLYFNCNVEKEEESFQKQQKVDRHFERSTKDSINEVQHYPYDHYTRHTTENNTKNDGYHPSVRQNYEQNAHVAPEKEVSRETSEQAETRSNPSHSISIENSESIPAPSIRAVSAAQPKKGELDLKKFHTPSMLPYRITGLEKNLFEAGTKYLIGTAYKGTNTQKGTEYAFDVYGTGTQFITDQIRIALTKSMIRDSNRVLASYHDILKEVCGENSVSSYGIIGNISSYKDVMRMQQGMNNILVTKYGKGIKGTGSTGYVNAIRFLMKNRKNIDPEIRKLITATYKRTSSIQFIKGRATRLRSIRQFGLRKMRRYLQQTDTGYGLYFTLDIISRTNSIIRGSIFAIRSILRAGEKATLLTIKASAWASAKAVKLAAKLVPETIKQTKAAQKISTGTKKIGNGYKKTKNVINNGRGKVNRFKQNLKKFRRDPFGIRTSMNKLGTKATNAMTRRLNKTILGKPSRTLGKGYRLTNRVIAFIGRFFSAIGSAVSTLIHLAFLGFTIIIFCGVLLSIFSTIVTMIFSLFDFNTHKKEIREACLQQIEESYENQMNEFNRLRGKYRNVTIHYTDLKDEDVYTAKNVAINETTNSAELLSMATVYFDFDLEKAGKQKAKKYIKELYNGSHLMSIVEKPYTYKDSEGNDVTVTDADVTLTTYYFNQLFNCELISGSSGVIAGSEITEQVWNYLRSAGVPAVQVAGIMGNIQAESDFRPDLIEHGNGIGFGLCQWSYGRRTALENFAASKGKSPGDLEIQLEFLLTELGPSNFNSYYTGENNYKRFMEATDPETAAYYFMWGWERPNKSAALASLNKRQTAARTYYDSYVDREIITDESEEPES